MREAARRLVALGNPVASPMPYVALWMGVPSVTRSSVRMSTTRPIQKNMWKAQHEGFMNVGAAHQYHLKKGNESRLVTTLNRSFPSQVEHVPLHLTRSSRKAPCRFRWKQTGRLYMRRNREQVITLIYPAGMVMFAGSGSWTWCNVCKNIRCIVFVERLGSSAKLNGSEWLANPQPAG